MRQTAKQKFLVFLALPLSLVSCGPGPQGPGPQVGGGIGGTGSVKTVSSGPVTKFGSVFVSGTEYDNSNTIYCIDDEPCGPQNTLKIGMVVLVDGRISKEYSSGQPLARIADTITYEETVEGIVQSVASDGLSLFVLGQLVRLNQKTVIDPSITGQSVHSLIPGLDLVEVSGFVTGDGEILATLIMKQADPPHYEIQGSVKNHDVKQKTFEIGALVVNYSSADTSEMPSPGTATWNNIVVQVRGDQSSQGGPGPHGAKLTATLVKPLTLGVEDDSEAEVEGVILQVNAPGDFFVNNTHVMTTTSTIIEGGTINDLVMGAQVEIHGSLGNGVLQASHISLDD